MFVGSEWEAEFERQAASPGRMRLEVSDGRMLVYFDFKVLGPAEESVREYALQLRGREELDWVSGKLLGLANLDNRLWSQSEGPQGGVVFTVALIGGHLVLAYAKSGGIADLADPRAWFFAALTQDRVTMLLTALRTARIPQWDAVFAEQAVL